MTPLAIGVPAPSFTLPDLEGRLVSLAELSDGHRVVLFFMREFT